MTPQEIEERLADAEQVLVLLGKRLNKLEAREKSYSPLQSEQQSSGCAARLEELKGLLLRQDQGKHTLQILNQLSSFQEKISKWPNVLPVRHYHHFEDRARSFILGSILCVLLTAGAVGLSFSLYRENSRLQETGTKYSLIQQLFPEAAQQVDSIFHAAP